MLRDVSAVVERAQLTFHRYLERVDAQGGITRDSYVRYLSFQHHLTRGVQRHLLAVTSHESQAGRRQFRDFLYDFALEEEPHFEVARQDLAAMGEVPLPCPFDVQLWWAYFDGLVHTRPFVRLGATCVLENLGAGAGRLGHDLLDRAAFLNGRNTRFLQIHFHEVLPHGAQIVSALEAASLSPSEIADLEEGALHGAVLYLRLARWALGLPTLYEELAGGEAANTVSVAVPSTVTAVE